MRITRPRRARLELASCRVGILHDGGTRAGREGARIRLAGRRPSFTGRQRDCAEWLRGMNLQRARYQSGLPVRGISKATFGACLDGLEEEYAAARGRSLTVSTAEGYLKLLP